MLNGVMTITEASEYFEINKNTLKKAIMGDKDTIPLFWRSEARKSGNTWLVTKEGIERVFFREKGRYELPDNKKDIMMLGYYDGLYLRNQLGEEKALEYEDRISKLLRADEVKYTEVEFEKLAPVLMELDTEDMKVKTPYAYISDKDKYMFAVVSMLHGLKGLDFLYNVNDEL